MADKKGSIVIIKRIKKVAHGAHGGAWKVAYADFVTAMMCFFLVMWLMGSDEETKATIAHYFNHPQTPFSQGKDPRSDAVNPMGEREGPGNSVLNGLDGQNPDDLVQSPIRPISPTAQEHHEMSELIQEILDGQAYAIDIDIEHMKFSIPESLLFKPGTSRLTADASRRLDRLGQLFKGYRGYFTIEGHTDESPKRADGTAVSAYEVSLARAVAVMNFLVERHWVSEDRVFPLGSGTRRSLASSTTEGDPVQKNRRVEFTLSVKRTF